MFFLMVAVEKRHLPANNIVISTMFIKLKSTLFECRYNLQVLGRFTGDWFFPWHSSCHLSGS